MACTIFPTLEFLISRCERQFDVHQSPPANQAPYGNRNPPGCALMNVFPKFSSGSPYIAEIIRLFSNFFLLQAQSIWAMRCIDIGYYCNAARWGMTEKLGTWSKFAKYRAFCCFSKVFLWFLLIWKTIHFWVKFLKCIFSQFDLRFSLKKFQHVVLILKQFSNDLLDYNIKYSWVNWGHLIS